MSSLASVKGPSMTVLFLPENLTRAPLELGWRPSRASRTPALLSSSLYLPISSRSSGSGRAPCFSASGVDLTMTMNRIFCPFGLETDVSFDLEHNWLASADAFQLDLCQY